MRVNCAPRISCSPFLFRTQERVDTILLDCPGRLSWRHRARPSATLHEIQARSQGANLNTSFLAQSVGDCKSECAQVFSQQAMRDVHHIGNIRVESDYRACGGSAVIPETP